MIPSYTIRLYIKNNFIHVKCNLSLYSGTDGDTCKIYCEPLTKSEFDNNEYTDIFIDEKSTVMLNEICSKYINNVIYFSMDYIKHLQILKTNNMLLTIFNRTKTIYLNSFYNVCKKINKYMHNFANTFPNVDDKCLYFDIVRHNFDLDKFITTVFPNNNFDSIDINYLATDVTLNLSHRIKHIKINIWNDIYNDTYDLSNSISLETVTIPQYLKINVILPYGCKLNYIGKNNSE